MKLTELCEPLFQYICRLNRSARKGGGVNSYEPVRNDIKTLLADIQYKAKSDPALASQLENPRGGIYPALLCFVDFMIHSSKLPFAAKWQNIAEEETGAGSEQKFFDLLDQSLADRTDAGTERVAVYYTCMGLGFTGPSFGGQTEYLRRKMLECSARLRGRINANQADPVCPEAYNPDTRMLFKPIRSSLVGMTIVLIVLLGAVLVINGYQYYQKSAELTQTLDQLKNAPEKTTPTPATRPTTAPAARAVAGSG